MSSIEPSRPFGMIEVPLTRGLCALVDDNDDWVLDWNWYSHPMKNGKRFYAARMSSRKDGPRRVILLHREIVHPPNHLEVDHRNGNTLDDQKSNLRIADDKQNAQNKRKQSNNTSGVVGVTWCPARNRWLSKITLNGRDHKHVQRYFWSFEDAVKCRKEMEQTYFGEFARQEENNAETRVCL